MYVNTLKRTGRSQFMLVGGVCGDISECVGGVWVAPQRVLVPRTRCLARRRRRKYPRTSNPCSQNLKSMQSKRRMEHIKQANGIPQNKVEKELTFNKYKSTLNNINRDEMFGSGGCAHEAPFYECMSVCMHPCMHLYMYGCVYVYRHRPMVQGSQTGSTYVRDTRPQTTRPTPALRCWSSRAWRGIAGTPTL